MNLKEKRRALNQKLTYRNISHNIRKWLATNTRTKIWIFIFTVLLWLVVMLNNRYTYSFSTIIEIRNIEPNKTLAEELPSHIQASFSGKGIDLLYLLLSSNKSFKFILDLRTIKWYYDFALNEYFQVNPEKVIIPRVADVKLEHIVWPDTVQVVLDFLQTVKVPVKPDVELTLAPGYIPVNSVHIVPDSVTLSGPQSFVKQYTVIPTEKIVLKNISGSVSQEVSLLFTPKNNIHMTPQKVYIQQEVDQLGERQLTNIPIQVINLGPDQKAEVIPSAATVTVSGGIENLKTIRPDDVKIVFDFEKDWRPGESFYTPTVELPQDLLAWKNLTPETFEIRIIRER